MTDNDDLAAALRLIQRIAAFADYLAEIRDADRQVVRAQAARMAALRLRTYRPDGALRGAPPITHDVSRRVRHR